MAHQKMTEECQKQFKKIRKSTETTVIVRTKAKAIGEKRAREAYKMLTGERFATRRSHLMMADLKERYGAGRDFCKNLSDSRQSEQRKVIDAAPKANSLWLAGAVAVGGTRSEIEELAEHEDIEAVDANPTFKLPEILKTPLEDTPETVDGNTWGLAKTRAPDAWGGYGRGAGVRVGHLDTGVDDTHPALAGKVAEFEEFDNLGNPLGTAPHDSGQHGTHTAGTICGGNFQGTNLGVAPEAELVSGLVLPGGSGTFAQIVAGMQWAVDQNAQLINMSLGGQGYTTLWNLPVLNSLLGGALVVASIGNSGHGTSGGPGNDFFALGVGATHYQDVPAGFSSGQTLVGVSHDVLTPIFGPLTYMKPNISAPGAQVLSSIPDDAAAVFNGTSMAAPHVAGAGAVVQSTNPAILGNPFATRAVLLGTVEDFGEAGTDQRFGMGRLDVLAAAQLTVGIS